MIFGNWVLSYLNKDDVHSVLQNLRMMLKPKGALIIKEGVLKPHEKKSRVCHREQGLRYRSFHFNDECIRKVFTVKQFDCIVHPELGLQYIWLAKKR